MPFGYRRKMFAGAAACILLAATGGAVVPKGNLSSPEDAPALERAFVSVADRVGPAVVSIVASETVITRFNPWGDDDFFRFFFNTPQQPYEQKRLLQSAGSGFIVSPDGYILTNAHVIGRAKDVVVKLPDKKEYKARIIGIDEDTDVAVIKIKADGRLTVAELGDSDAIKVGQWAIAIGNPFGLDNTLTVGVISAKGRQLVEDRRLNAEGTPPQYQYTNFIQTDASINRGNSGGPLINIRGEVIGINTMIYSPSGGSIGIGFAIPVNLAKLTMEGLIKGGKIVRPQLGIAYRPLEPAVAKKLGLPPGVGVEVSGVIKGSAADQSGLKPGDIILSIDRKPLKEKEDLRSTVLQHKVGDRIALDVYRKNKHLSVEVVLKEKAGDKTAGPGPEGRSEQPEENKAVWLGMTVIDLTEELAQKLETPDTAGAIVVAVAPDSPAGISGVQPYDIIREVEQMPVAGLKDFNEIRKRVGDKDSVLLLVERQGSTMYIVVSKEKRGPAE